MMNVEIKGPRTYLNVNRYHDYNQTLVYEEQRFRTFTKLVFFFKDIHEKRTNIEWIHFSYHFCQFFFLRWKFVLVFQKKNHGGGGMLCHLIDNAQINKPPSRQTV